MKERKKELGIPVYAIKVQGILEVQRQAFLTSKLDEGE